MDFRVSESCFDLNSHLAHGLWRLCRLILNWWHSQLYKSDHETAHPDFLCIIVHVLTSTERHLGISNKKMLWECSAKIEPVGSCKIIIITIYYLSIWGSVQHKNAQSFWAATLSELFTCDTRCHGMVAGIFVSPLNIIWVAIQEMDCCNNIERWIFCIAHVLCW